MQIVIDIPEEEYKDTLKGSFNITVFNKAVKMGVPLPKGHGRLIDADCAYKKFYNRSMAKVGKEVLDEVPTIIEADKESGVVFKTICNSCVICHKETIDPNPFYICDTCKEKIKADKAEIEPQESEEQA